METPTSGQQGSPRRRRIRAAVVVVAVVATVALAIGTIAIITRGHDETAGPPTPSASTKTVTVTPTVTPRATTPSPSMYTPSAVDSLGDFFSRAARLDEQLRRAAAGINAAGPPWTSVTPRIAGLVTVADLRPVQRAIPAGLPSGLRSAVILTYSDLSSRRHAMATFAHAGTIEGRTTADLLRELGNGSPAAARFARDLAGTKALASESAPIAAIPKSSRQTAETLLLIRYVETANGGCESRGGVVITKMPEIVWHHEEAEPHRDGTIGGIWFTARLDSNDDWQVDLSAC